MTNQWSQFSANWNYPTSIRFGVGRLVELPAACRELGMSRPLLITDPVLEALPITREALSINLEAGLPTAVFSAIKANPIGKNVEDGVAAFKEGEHDGVVAFGGGSALDAAKSVAMMVGQSRPVWDFEDVDDWYTRVDEAGMAPVVAVPTTSGTGSEVGRAAVLVDEQEQKKKIIFHPKMLPARVICDPALTTGMPANLTAWVGMDALSHSLEAVSSRYFHPMAEGVGMEGIRLVHTSLVRAFEDGGDIEARARMMAASTMGATAFQKGLGAMHAVSHAVGALFDTQHGLTNAVMMPYVMVFNRSEIEDKMARMARFIGLAQCSFDTALEWILELRQTLGIPHTLAEIGVTADRLDILVSLAVADPSGGTNPVGLTADNVRKLIVDAVEGR